MPGESFCDSNTIAWFMGATGICWDNAMAESFFSILKHKFISRHGWLTGLEQHAAIAWWIDPSTTGAAATA